MKKISSLLGLFFCVVIIFSGCQDRLSEVSNDVDDKVESEITSSTDASSNPKSSSKAQSKGSCVRTSLKQSNSSGGSRMTFFRLSGKQANIPLRRTA